MNDKPTPDSSFDNWLDSLLDEARETDPFTEGEKVELYQSVIQPPRAAAETPQNLLNSQAENSSFNTQTFFAQILNGVQRSPRRVKIAMCGCLVALLVPVGILWRRPDLSHDAIAILETNRLTEIATIDSIAGVEWKIHRRDASELTVQLAGIEPINSNWVAQANAVTAMLLSRSGNQIAIDQIPSTQKTWVYLPNGTLLQEVLVAEGLAKLDLSQAKLLPPQQLQNLQQSQQLAQQQRKNIWSSP